MLKKIDKQFVLSDSSLNVYGYKLITEGCRLEEFLSNPIGYFEHKDKENGTLVRWEDVSIQDGVIVGKPVINMSHPRGIRTATEIEDGFLNAASVGGLAFLAYEMQEIDGEDVIVITDWYFRECSLVSMPANENAVKQELKIELEVELSDNTNVSMAQFVTNVKKDFQNQYMKKVNLTPALLEMLDLSAESLADNIEEVISAKIGAIKTSNAELTAKVEALDKELTANKESALRAQVTAMLDKALDEQRITKATSENLAKTYATLPTELSALLSTMPKYESVSSKIDQATEKLATELSAMDYDQLDKEGKLEALKATNPEIFKSKFKQKFGKEYRGAL
jgi:hypothetical protein